MTASVKNRGDLALKGDLGPIGVVQQQLRDPSHAICPSFAQLGKRFDYRVETPRGTGRAITEVVIPSTPTVIGLRVTPLACASY